MSETTIFFIILVLTWWIWLPGLLYAISLIFILLMGVCAGAASCIYEFYLWIKDKLTNR